MVLDNLNAALETLVTEFATFGEKMSAEMAGQKSTLARLHGIS